MRTFVVFSALIALVLARIVVQQTFQDAKCTIQDSFHNEYAPDVCHAGDYWSCATPTEVVRAAYEHGNCTGQHHVELIPINVCYFDRILDKFTKYYCEQDFTPFPKGGDAVDFMDWADGVACEGEPTHQSITKTDTCIRSRFNNEFVYVACETDFMTSVEARYFPGDSGCKEPYYQAVHQDLGNCQVRDHGTHKTSHMILCKVNQ